jgi:hypothetical protein
MGEPAWADDDHVLHMHYDGVTNDLLTAGLGALGLQNATPPAIADPLWSKYWSQSHPPIHAASRW